MTIDYIDAILGATLETQVIGGDFVTFQVPPGTQEGDDIVLEGYGGRSLIGEESMGGVRGQHILTAHIAIPEEVKSQDEDELLRMLQVLRLEKNTNPALFQPRTMPATMPLTEPAEAVEVEANEYNVVTGFFSDLGAGGTIRVDKFEKKYVNNPNLSEEEEASVAMSNWEDTVYRGDEVQDVLGAVYRGDEEQDVFGAVYRGSEVQEVFGGDISDSIQQGPVPSNTASGSSSSSNFPYTNDEMEKQPYFAANHEYDPLKDLLNTPVQSSEEAQHDADRRQKDIQEAEELVARELEKLKDLLYAPIASTPKATKLKEAKLRRIKEAEDLVANEMIKLQELLNAPLESTIKATQLKFEKERRMEEANQVVKAELDKLSELLYSPIESSEGMTKAKAEPSNGGLRRKELERANELDKMTKLLRDQIEASGGASSTFVSQDPVETPFFTGSTRDRFNQPTSPPKAMQPPFSGTGEMNGVNGNGRVNGFGASSQPSRSVSSSSGLGEGVSIAADLVVEPDLHDVNSGIRQNIASEGIRKIKTNGSKAKPDDRDKPAGPQVASQALSASVVAVNRPEVSPPARCMVFGT